MLVCNFHTLTNECDSKFFSDVCRLLGSVTAGSSGDETAVIAAGDLQPSHIQIAAVTTKTAYLQRTGSIYGKLAFISLEEQTFDQSTSDSVPKAPYTPFLRIQRLKDKLFDSARSWGKTATPELEATTASAWPAHADDDLSSTPSMKVVPLARPFLPFGPAASQLLKADSETKTCALLIMTTSAQRAYDTSGI
jgi:hypothetical protein